MPSSHIKALHKGKKRSLLEARASTTPNAACSTGGFYISPKIGDTVDALKTLNIAWDSTCLSSPSVDIYLYAPGATLPRIHVWESVALSRKTYAVDLMPRWWNSTASQNLQLNIVPAGSAPFLSQLPAGPTFTATYTQPASGVPDSANVNKIDTGYTLVNDLAGTHKMTSGKAAAAVLLPLIFIALCVGAYIKVKRSRNIDKRKKWTEAVDKRMSTISTDWKSVSAAGATAAIRNSMAVGNRSSSFSFGALRPSSQYITDGDDSGAPKRNTAQMRPGVGLRNPAALTSTERVSRVSFAADTRVSRVSFANDPRPSGESRRTKVFRDSYAPPVPALPAVISTLPQENDVEESGSLSPRQTQGPLTLTPEDIRARIAAGRTRSIATQDSVSEKRVSDEIDEVMPALSMMRTGGTEIGATNSDDYLFSGPTPPVPTYPKLTSSTPSQEMASPVMATMPMQPMPASVMSPDDMLRAYAERKKSINAGKPGITTSSISYPMPVANGSNAHIASAMSSNGMRTLFNGNPVSPTTTGNGVPLTPTLGFGVGEYDSGFGTNGYVFGHQVNESLGDGVGVYGGARYAIGDDEEDVGVAGRGAYGGMYGGGRA